MKRTIQTVLMMLSSWLGWLLVLAGITAQLLGGTENCPDWVIYICALAAIVPTLLQDFRRVFEADSELADARQKRDYYYSEARIDRRKNELLQAECEKLKQKNHALREERQAADACIEAVKRECARVAKARDEAQAYADELGQKVAWLEKRRAKCRRCQPPCRKNT